MIKKYDGYLILERYDKNIRAKLIELGVTDEVELKKQISLSKKGHLGHYLSEKGQDFTFGMLKAIFKDAIQAKKVTDLKKGVFSLVPILGPLSLVYFYPIIAVISAIFGTSRLFHKIFDIIFNYLEPQSKYSDFLKKMIDTYMKIPEGRVELKDRFSRAFVVSDRLIDAIKPEVVAEFTNYLSNKMEQEDDNKKVPDQFIENELKEYLNVNFGHK